MQLDITQRSGAMHVALRGKLDLMTVSLFREEFWEAVPKGSTVVLDLEELTFVDSSGVGGIITTRDHVKQLYLIGASGQVASVLKFTNLGRFFPILTQQEFDERFPK